MKKFLKEQFEQLAKIDGKDSVILLYKKPIEDIAAIMGTRGHSGMSAAIEAKMLCNAIGKLLMYTPITPIDLTDESQWVKASDDYFQNKRYSALFKNKDGQISSVDAVSYREYIVNGKRYKGNSLFGSGAFGKWVYTKDIYYPINTQIIDMISIRTNKDGKKDDDGGSWEHLGFAETENNYKAIEYLTDAGYKLYRDGKFIDPKSLIIKQSRLKKFILDFLKKY